jgi:hypothetical protein
VAAFWSYFDYPFFIAAGIVLIGYDQVSYPGAVCPLCSSLSRVVATGTATKISFLPANRTRNIYPAKTITVGEKETGEQKK